MATSDNIIELDKLYINENRAINYANDRRRISSHANIYSKNTQTKSISTNSLELLAQVPESISAQNLYMLLRQKQPFGLATVYRVLETLKRNRLIRSRINQHSESLYSIISQDEHRLTCINCGESVQIDKCPIQAINHDFDQSNQFKIYYHTLESFGSCKHCTEKSDR